VWLHTRSQLIDAMVEWMVYEELRLKYWTLQNDMKLQMDVVQKLKVEKDNLGGKLEKSRKRVDLLKAEIEVFRSGQKRKKGKVSMDVQAREKLETIFKKAKRKTQRITDFCITVLLEDGKMKKCFQKQIFEREELRKVVVEEVNKKMRKYEVSVENDKRSYLQLLHDADVGKLAYQRTRNRSKYKFDDDGNEEKWIQNETPEGLRIPCFAPYDGAIDALKLLIQDDGMGFVPLKQIGDRGGGMRDLKEVIQGMEKVFREKEKEVVFFEDAKKIFVVVWVDQTSDYTTMWLRFLNLGTLSSRPAYLRFVFGLRGPEDSTELRDYFKMNEDFLCEKESMEFQYGECAHKVSFLLASDASFLHKLIGHGGSSVKHFHIRYRDITMATVGELLIPFLFPNDPRTKKLSGSGNVSSDSSNILVRRSHEDAIAGAKLVHDVREENKDVKREKFDKLMRDQVRKVSVFYFIMVKIIIMYLIIFLITESWTKGGSYV
jgi:hypothetical protein